MPTDRPHVRALRKLGACEEGLAYVMLLGGLVMAGHCATTKQTPAHAQEAPAVVNVPQGGYPEIIWRGPDGSELRINFNGSKFHAIASDPP